MNFWMNFWILSYEVFLLLGLICVIYTARKANVKLAQATEQIGGLTDRLARIDERLAALETLVIEREKQAKFDNIL